MLHSAVFYPYDYGFVPSTLCGDGDPLDILVLSTFSLAPGVHHCPTASGCACAQAPSLDGRACPMLGHVLQGSRRRGAVSE